MRKILSVVSGLLLVLFVFLGAPNPAFAQPHAPQLISGAPTEAQKFFVFENDLYFSSTNINTEGFWKYDGNSFVNISNTVFPIDYAVFNNDLYIAGQVTGTSNYGLYKVTTAGLIDVADIDVSNFNHPLGVFNGLLYFSTTAAGNYDVYTYDGSSISSSPLNGMPCCFGYGTTLGGKMYFSGWHPPGSFDLYSWDGINTVQYDTAGRLPREIQVLENELFFIGLVNPSNSWDYSWFKVSGTSTLPVATPGVEPLNWNTVFYNNQIVFQDANQPKIYSFDGTNATLLPINNFEIGGAVGKAGDFLYYGGTADSEGNVLFQFDGTSSQPIPGSNFDGSIENMFEFQGKLYFVAGNDMELYSLDPSPVPTLAKTGTNSDLASHAFFFTCLGLFFYMLGRKVTTRA